MPFQRSGGGERGRSPPTTSRRRLGRHNVADRRKTLRMAHGDIHKTEGNHTNLAAVCASNGFSVQHPLPSGGCAGTASWQSLGGPPGPYLNGHRKLVPQGPSAVRRGSGSLFGR